MNPSCRAIWTDWMDGLRTTVGVSTRTNQGPALRSQPPHAMLQAWEAVAGKLPSGKGSWDDGRYPAEHEPAVCPRGQEGQQHPGLYQE